MHASLVLMLRVQLVLLLLLSSRNPSNALFHKKDNKAANAQQQQQQQQEGDYSTRTTLDSTVLYNFHANRPIAGDKNVRETLQDLQLYAPDSYIQQILDQVLDKSLYSSDIVLQYKPHRKWLWRQWHGTILPHSVGKVLLHMIVSVIVCCFVGTLCPATSSSSSTDAPLPWWRLATATPNDSCVWMERLRIINQLWKYQMQLTTFILTFFVGQAYALWREVYTSARKIQGRLHDISILLATHVLAAAASHDDDNNNNNKKNKNKNHYPQQADLFLQTIARHVRLFTILFWASQSRQFKVLLTNRGMRQMQQAGLLTAEELTTLLQVPTDIMLFWNGS